MIRLNAPAAPNRRDILVIFSISATGSAAGDTAVALVEVHIELRPGGTGVVRERYFHIHGPAFSKFQLLTDSSAEIQRMTIREDDANNDYAMSKKGPWISLTLKPENDDRNFRNYTVSYAIQLFNQDSSIPIAMPAQPLSSNQSGATIATIRLDLPADYRGGSVYLPQMEVVQGSDELAGSFPALPSIVRFHFPAGVSLPRRAGQSNRVTQSFLERQLYPFLVLQLVWLVLYFRWARASAAPMSDPEIRGPAPHA